MAELNLEPYTAHLHWELLRPVNDFAWRRLFVDYLERLAARCEVDGQSVIGHIKGVATIEGGGFLRASVVAADQPADVHETLPADCRSLVFTINVLVYGLSYDQVASHVTELASAITRRWEVAVTVKPVADHHPSHHHHSS